MIVHDDGKLRIALLNDLCVLRWMDSPRVAQFDAVLRVTQKPAAVQRLALLNVTDAPAGIMPQLSNVELAAAKRMSVGLKNVTKAVAHVILLEGFAGVSTRMVISTLMLVRRSGSPNKVFSAMDEGQRWLAPYISNPKVAARMNDLYASLCTPVPEH